MSRFPTISIPAAADKTAADIRQSVEALRVLTQTATRLDGEITQAAPVIEAARRDLDAAETAVAVAEETGGDIREAGRRRDSARAALASAEKIGDHKRRARLGIDAQREAIEIDIAAQRPALDQVFLEIRGIMRANCSKALRSAMTGPLGLLDAMRFCAMSRAVIREPGPDLFVDAIRVCDPLFPGAPGAPAHRLIDGRRYFDEAGAIEDLAVSWLDILELVLIGKKVEPFVRLSGEVATIANRVREREERARLAAPAPPAPAPEPTEEEILAERVARTNAARNGAPFTPMSYSMGTDAPKSGIAAELAKRRLA